jgi:hypothetical protein
MTQLRKLYLLTLFAFLPVLLPFVASSRAQEVTGKAANPGSDLVGVWRGTTRAGCALNAPPSRCNALQKVSITVLKGEGDKVTGSYTCAYGNQDCYDMNETGKLVEASMSGSQVMFRVQMPDGTACIYTGHVNNDDVNGGYDCMSGGAPIERGSWLAHRIY